MLKGRDRPDALNDATINPTEEPPSQGKHNTTPGTVVYTMQEVRPCPRYQTKQDPFSSLDVFF